MGSESKLKISMEISFFFFFFMCATFKLLLSVYFNAVTEVV